MSIYTIIVMKTGSLSEPFSAEEITAAVKLGSSKRNPKFL